LHRKIAAVERLQPEGAILCGPAPPGVLVHRAEPAVQLILVAQHAVRAVFQDFLRGLDGGVLQNATNVLWRVGLSLLLLVQLVVSSARSGILPRRPLTDPAQRASRRCQDRGLLRAGRPN